MYDNDEEIKLYDNEEVYRPGIEKNSALLEIGQGCSWGKCTFCDFIHDECKFFSNDKIEAKIKLLQPISQNQNRVFLLSENAFSLSFDRIMDILMLIKLYMPQINEVSMYARAEDILKKDMNELETMKMYGLNDLHVGVESGSDNILKMCNKGTTKKNLLLAFQNLDLCKIGYNLTSILGLGGKKLSTENAIETGKLFSNCHPKSITVNVLKLFKNTPLYEQVQNKQFKVLSPIEMLEEEILMLQNTNICGCNCFYNDPLVLGKYAIAGILPSGKSSIIEKINMIIASEPQ